MHNATSDNEIKVESASLQVVTGQEVGNYIFCI